MARSHGPEPGVQAQAKDSRHFHPSWTTGQGVICLQEVWPTGPLLQSPGFAILDSARELVRAKGREMNGDQV